MLLALLALSAFAAEEQSLDALVLEVIDGDTVRVLIRLGDGLQRVDKVRLAAIDTPEMKEPGGPEAKEYVTRMIGGKNVSLVVRLTRDGRWRRGKYHRIIGRIVYHDQDLGELLLKRGLAKPYRGAKGSVND